MVYFDKFILIVVMVFFYRDRDMSGGIWWIWFGFIDNCVDIGIRVCSMKFVKF